MHYALHILAVEDFWNLGVILLSFQMPKLGISEVTLLVYKECVLGSETSALGHYAHRN